MSRQVLLVADVGGPTHDHAGDEAILTARMAWLRRAFPSLDPVAVSEDPCSTSSRHGIRSLKEPALPVWADRSWVYQWRYPALVARYLEGMARLRAPELHQLLLAVSDSALLFICGGGSLTSSAGRLLRLRSHLAGYAQACGVPVIVTGQQIGPELSPADTRILRHWLPRARLVGVRDATTSARLAVGLGVPVERLLVTGDDALTLESARPAAPWLDFPDHPPVIGLSLHNPGSAAQRTTWLAQLVSRLGPFLTESGASILLLPHLRSEVGHRCDRLLLQEFVAATGLEARVLPQDDLRRRDVQLKGLTGVCDFVITTRFHGAVFALTTGVPCLALSYDDYTDSKFNGLGDYFGLELAVRRLYDPDMISIMQVTWRNRKEMALRLSESLAKTFARHHGAQRQIRDVVEALV